MCCLPASAAGFTLLPGRHDADELLLHHAGQANARELQQAAATGAAFAAAKRLIIVASQPQLPPPPSRGPSQVSASGMQAPAQAPQQVRQMEALPLLPQQPPAQLQARGCLLLWSLPMHARLFCPDPAWRQCLSLPCDSAGRRTGQCLLARCHGPKGPARSSDVDLAERTVLSIICFLHMH